ncbi:protein SHQ1 [Sesbania bispinosa]|nr:protein SHQ1 [Sesbania bispinosa]
MKAEVQEDRCQLPNNMDFPIKKQAKGNRSIQAQNEMLTDDVKKKSKEELNEETPGWMQYPRRD